MSTELFGAGPNINNLNAGEVTDCRPLATTDYMDLLWTTLAEYVSYIYIHMIYHIQSVSKLNVNIFLTYSQAQAQQLLF